MDPNDNLPENINLEELVNQMLQEIEETSIFDFIAKHRVRDPDSPFGRPVSSEAPDFAPWKPGCGRF